MLAKRYVATLNEVSTREAAHRFADEIIKALGGGLPGINQTRVSFVSSRTGHQEIWVMDYDGFNQHPITSYRSTCTTPRWSPDNTKLAFTSYASGNPELYIFSFETGKRMPFPSYKGLNTTPAWCCPMAAKSPSVRVWAGTRNSMFPAPTATTCSVLPFRQVSIFRRFGTPRPRTKSLLFPTAAAPRRFTSRLRTEPICAG